MSRASAQPGFVHHAAIYAFGQVALYAAPLLMAALYTRALTLTDFGTITILQRIGEVLGLCLLFNGTRQASIALYGQADEARRERIVASTLWVALALLLLGMGLALALTALSGAWPALQINPGLLLLALAAALLDGTTYVLLGLPQARQEPHVVVTANLSHVFTKIALSFLFVACFGWGLHGVFLAMVLPSSLLLTALLFREVPRLRGRMGVPWGTGTTVIRDLMHFSLPFLPGGLCLFLLNTGDRFLIWQWTGKEEVATYDLGYRLAMACYSLSVGPLNMVWGTRMYQAALSPDGPQVFGRATTRVLLVYTATALAGCLFAREGVFLLSGAKYAAAATIIPPVALALWFLTAATLFDGPFYITRRTGLKTLVSIASALAVAAFYALLIPPLGGIGAAWATLAGFAVQATLTRLVGQRLYRVAYEDGRMIWGLGIAVALWGVSLLLPPGPCGFPARVFLWLVFPAALWATGTLGAEERAWASARLREVSRQLKQWVPVRA